MADVKGKMSLVKNEDGSEPVKIGKLKKDKDAKIEFKKPSSKPSKEEKKGEGKQKCTSEQRALGKANCRAEC